MKTQMHQFVIDDSGNKTAVLLPIEEYERLVDEAEELEAIQEYDVAKATNDEVIPFEQALTEIERNRL